MTRYWVRNEDGTVLGPVGLMVIKDLAAAGQLSSIKEVSVDGQKWKPLGAFPELNALVPAASGAGTAAGEAEQIRAEIKALRLKSPHEIFGVPRGAGLNEVRAAFFEKVKRYHPQRLPRGAPREIQEACGEMFKFLSDLMLAVQTGRTGSAPGGRTPAPLAHTPPPMFGAEAFVGLLRGANGTYQVNLALGPKTVELFTRHKLVNVQTGGFFIPDRVIPLGTAMDITLTFQGDPRVLSTRGKVVVESAGQDPRQPKGSGVQLNLSPAERTFLQTFVSALTPKGEKSQG